MIGVLIVDDSPTLREVLVRAVEGQQDLEVRAVARDGAEAVAAVTRWQPDVICMDLNMPRVGGLEAIRQIMGSRPTPIVVLTALSGAAVSLEALAAGALEVLEKPAASDPRSLERIMRSLRLMADVKVVGRRASGPLRPVARPASVRPRLVCLASSTGGPAILREILEPLPAAFPLPLVVVQHIAAGFERALADWLQSALALRVCLASANCLPEPGTVYLAPDDRHHLMIGSAGQIAFSLAPPVRGPRPAATVLFESAARSLGSAVLGVTLTGMGADGADGTAELRSRGAVCLAQDPATCAAPGMPQEVIKRNLACEILGPGGLSEYLLGVGRQP